MDCSGLIVAIARQVDSSYDRLYTGGFEAMCTNTITDGTVPNTPGTVVWMSGHVAIHTGNQYTVEAVDTTSNYALRKHKSAFTKCGYLDFVEYN